ncbi:MULTISPECIES: class I SAM-dependent methyltransferase [unclassified Colwellia]|uniref:class I SAM-dependent methyltransferase n=1 Tax=unclassified Colwellia TaxID=196834 RepID=UPI0015F414C5|nr:MULTISPECIES: class I SAM-dependent methyltransferase [unclassified Colwellia]MBA6233198.1 class I SAM-dependent methyltransferase [Colwellia sp. MB02u-7]MBA6236288.1 class I SAM-dependent methyltransferase [Colwellia sp. MB02u-11]MBA6256826.1 class I SAM-dependent methyltransferase [Colwellia sp. MB3u-28]MBA6261168.1 class I SAM-dependent methyltransferase [Colwellia sp. MB3u-41]MBA6264111.1 class I SAM-dependent methyltransferase [Colwellia sp. Bg11-12]
MTLNWHELIEKAWNDRKDLLESDEFDCWRVFHGYTEGASGVVIEKFGTMVIVEYKDDIRDDLDEIKDALLQCFPFTLILAKGDQSIGLRLKDRMYALHGDISDAPKFAKEYGISYGLLPDAMHNCGLYLDARPVRKWLAHNSEGRRVLNLFSFTGSLGIAALKGGAKAAIHLDKSKALLPRIQNSYEINGMDFGTRSFIQGDIYKHLPKAIKNGQRFDGIILDPPPKVYKSPYSEHQPKGQDFSRLVSLCSKLLNPGGWLICLFHRYDATWDQSDAEIIASSSDTLKMTERFTSECDFPDDNVDRKLRVTVFEKI